MPPGIKVAVIAGQLVVGGAERQLYLWLSNLDRSRFNPVVLTLHPGHEDYWEKPIEALDIPLIRIPPRKFRLQRYFDIIKAIKPLQPRLIHGWHLFASPYAGLAGKHLKASSLGGLRDTFKTFRSHRWLALLTLALTDGIVANSLSAAEELSDAYPCKAKHVFAVQNAVDVQFEGRVKVRSALTKEFDLPNNKIIIGAISRLAAKKRFDLLIKMIGELKKQTEDFHVLLIGDGPEREDLQQLAAEQGVREWITFAREVPNAHTWLPGLDIFCFTSWDEGLANVLMEAACAGLPIAAWQFPFNEELLKNNETALLFEFGNVEGMAAGIHRLMGSTALRNKLGSAARSHVTSHFSVPRYVQAMTDVYETFLAGQP